MNTIRRMLMLLLVCSAAHRAVAMGKLAPRLQMRLENQQTIEQKYNAAQSFIQGNQNKLQSEKARKALNNLLNKQFAKAEGVSSEDAQGYAQAIVTAIENNQPIPDYSKAATGAGPTTKPAPTDHVQEVIDEIAKALGVDQKDITEDRIVKNAQAVYDAVRQYMIDNKLDWNDLKQVNQNTINVDEQYINIISTLYSQPSDAPSDFKQFLIEYHEQWIQNEDNSVKVYQRTKQMYELGAQMGDVNASATLAYNVGNETGLADDEAQRLANGLVFYVNNISTNLPDTYDEFEAQVHAARLANYLKNDTSFTDLNDASTIIQDIQKFINDTLRVSGDPSMEDAHIKQALNRHQFVFNQLPSDKQTNAFKQALEQMAAYLSNNNLDTLVKEVPGNILGVANPYETFKNNISKGTIQTPIKETSDLYNQVKQHLQDTNVVNNKSDALKIVENLRQAMQGGGYDDSTQNTVQPQLLSDVMQTVINNYVDYDNLPNTLQEFLEDSYLKNHLPTLSDATSVYEAVTSALQLHPDVSNNYEKIGTIVENNATQLSDDLKNHLKAGIVYYFAYAQKTADKLPKYDNFKPYMAKGILVEKMSGVDRSQKNSTYGAMQNALQVIYDQGYVADINDFAINQMRPALNAAGFWDKEVPNVHSSLTTWLAKGNDLAKNIPKYTELPKPKPASIQNAEAAISSLKDAIRNVTETDLQESNIASAASEAITQLKAAHDDTNVDESSVKGPLYELFGNKAGDQRGLIKQAIDAHVKVAPQSTVQDINNLVDQTYLGKETGKAQELVSEYNVYSVQNLAKQPSDRYTAYTTMLKAYAVMHAVNQVVQDIKNTQPSTVYKQYQSAFQQHVVNGLLTYDANNVAPQFIKEELKQMHQKLAEYITEKLKANNKEIRYATDKKSSARALLDGRSGTGASGFFAGVQVAGNNWQMGVDELVYHKLGVMYQLRNAQMMMFNDITGNINNIQNNLTDAAGGARSIVANNTSLKNSPYKDDIASVLYKDVKGQKRGLIQVYQDQVKNLDETTYNNNQANIQTVYNHLDQLAQAFGTTQPKAPGDLRPAAATKAGGAPAKPEQQVQQALKNNKPAEAVQSLPTDPSKAWPIIHNLTEKQANNMVSAYDNNNKNKLITLVENFDMAKAPTKTAAQRVHNIFVDKAINLAATKKKQSKLENKKL